MQGLSSFDHDHDRDDEEAMGRPTNSRLPTMGCVELPAARADTFPAESGEAASTGELAASAQRRYLSVDKCCDLRSGECDVGRSVI